MSASRTEYLNKLVSMANQVVENQQYGKDEKQLHAAVYNHLKRFWTPKMQRAINDDIGSLSNNLHPILPAVFKQLV